MEMKNKKLKINFQEEEKEKKDFNPEEMIDVKTEAMPIPELMKNDYKKMEMFSRKRRSLE